MATFATAKLKFATDATAINAMSVQTRFLFGAAVCMELIDLLRLATTVTEIASGGDDQFDLPWRLALTAASSLAKSLGSSCDPGT